MWKGAQHKKNVTTTAAVTKCMQVTGHVTKNTVVYNDTKRFGEDLHFLPLARNLLMILSGSACSQATMPPHQLMVSWILVL